MADTRYDRIFRAFLAVAALLLVVSTGPAEAQQQRDMGNWDADRSSATQSQAPGSDLPSWAEPGARTREVPGGGLTSKALPGTPGEEPPQQIPVDGGLALLAVAGAGYAVRKLRNTPDDEPQDDVI
jgi:hypothetical protein